MKVLRGKGFAKGRSNYILRMIQIIFWIQKIPKFSEMPYECFLVFLDKELLIPHNTHQFTFRCVWLTPSCCAILLQQTMSVGILSPRLGTFDAHTEPMPCSCPCECAPCIMGGFCATTHCHEQEYLL